MSVNVLLEFVSLIMYRLSVPNAIIMEREFRGQKNRLCKSLQVASLCQKETWFLVSVNVTLATSLCKQRE